MKEPGWMARPLDSVIMRCRLPTYRAVPGLTVTPADRYRCPYKAGWRTGVVRGWAGPGEPGRGVTKGTGRVLQQLPLATWSGLPGATGPWGRAKANNSNCSLGKWAVTAVSLYGVKHHNKISHRCGEGKTHISSSIIRVEFYLFKTLKSPGK